MQQQTQAKKGRRVRKAKKRTVSSGHVYIKSTFNNTMITITEENGEVIAWNTAGRSGFKGSKKSTPYAASLASKAAATKAVEMGMTKAHVFVQGVGSGRDSAIRSLDSAGLQIVAIKDITPLPHNGPRPRKSRRV
ncbi:MAG: 30S ribosomal protein S11 [Patescibacteria group bacterium]|nr:30S ribosomal protein S11 [Patescibacteria group bacterium]